MAATFRTSAAGGSSSGTGNRTATITPAVGDLFVVYCTVAANTNDVPTCSDNNGGSYDRIDTMNFAIGAVNYRQSVFVRTSLLANTTSTVVTVATGSNSSGVVHVHAWAGMTRTGSSAVRSKGSQNNQAAGTAAPTLNQAALTGNPTAVVQGSGDTTTTPPTGWTERQDTNQSNDTVAMETATRDSGFTGTTITFGAASSTVFCSHALELDSSPPVYTASAAITHGARTASGTATFVAPVFTGSAAVTDGALTASGTASFVGFFTGTAAVTHAALSATAAGVTSSAHNPGPITQLHFGTPGMRFGSFSGKTETPPYAEGTAAVSVGAHTCSASGTTSSAHNPGPITQLRSGTPGMRYGSFAGKGGALGQAAVTTGALTASGIATFSPPVFTATAAVTHGALTAVGTATFVIPVYDGTGVATHAALTVSAAATFTPPVYTGSTEVTHGALTASGTALFASAIYIGSSAVTHGAITASGSATFTIPTYIGGAVITTGALVASGTAQGEQPQLCDYPSEDDVRDGVVYANGTMTGNLTLPSESVVAFGVSFGATGDEFTGTFECSSPPVPPVPTSDIMPFALISYNIVARVAYALGTTTDWVRPAASDSYELTEFENLFAVIRCYGPYPIDPTTGATFANDGAGRHRRVVARRVRVYIYTRSGVDSPGGDEIALQGQDPAQNVTTPPTMPGAYVAEELVLNALDNWTPTYVDNTNTTRPLTIGPLHFEDSASGPPERPPENEVGIVRSHIDFTVAYVQAIQRVEPAPASLPVPNHNN